MFFYLQTMQTYAPILDIQAVSKRYDSLQALNNLSFTVQPGEIFALLGPNGAGKTTLIGCITGLISRFEGSISVAGYDVKSASQITRQLIGFVPQELNFDGFFTTREVLHFQGGFYNVKPDNQKIEKILDDFGLLEKADVNTRQLSGGMKRRLMICKALLHDPVLLFLDEPTAGVDVELRDELWSYIENLKAQGVTIFLTTHYLEEAEKLADRIGIINKGKLLMIEDREAILNQFGRRWNLITTRNPVSDRFKTAMQSCPITYPEANQIKLSSPELDDCGDHSLANLQTVLDELKADNNEIIHIDGGRSSLESIFKEIVSADSQDSAML